MEMNSVMATEIVAAEVEHIVLPQIVSVKQASRMLGLPPYYLRRLCKEVPGVAFQSGIKWYINLGKLVDYYNNAGRITAGCRYSAGICGYEKYILCRHGRRL